MLLQQSSSKNLPACIFQDIFFSRLAVFHPEFFVASDWELRFQFLQERTQWIRNKPRNWLKQHKLLVMCLELIQTISKVLCVYLFLLSYLDG